MQKSKNIYKNILFVCILLINVLFYLVNAMRSQTCFASTIDTMYTIYTLDGNYLFERAEVYVGDEYVSSDFKKYVISEINDATHIGYATFICDVPKYNINYDNMQPIATTNKTICMYMTHNDESYVPSDGVDSVYGNGGICDVARYLKSELEKYSVNVVLDTSLHVPHDTSAYSRSEVTAKSLINNYQPSAIFDIHRDGASRNFYVKKVDNIERCKVRIVLGKRNPDIKKNEQFALALQSVALVKYPWLFSDIYYASGHYNQALSDKALLFELGSHLTEKELVQSSMQPLSDVICTTLFGSTVNDDSMDITIHEPVESDNVDLVGDDASTHVVDKPNNYAGIKITMALFTIISLASGIVYLVRRDILNDVKTHSSKEPPKNE